MPDTEEPSIELICPRCNGENVVEQEKIDLPVKCQDCGLETTEEHLMEFNKPFIDQQLEEIEAEILKPFDDFFK